ncbi:hypothetical protein [Mycoplasmopsis cynos]|uniref:hypothetical protein n=1 Tax=Mycoplasmopsis cynos TaxID=171284 RepID=UPI00220AE8B3|nr:hypothetical protein [Mycoplasmopsis cynos]UWV77938.1 hypothetical protein NW070_02390 [Mycoplasmopsis cynos]
MLDSEKQQLASQYLSSEYFFFSSNRQLFEFIKEKETKQLVEWEFFMTFMKLKLL